MTQPTADADVCSIGKEGHGAGAREGRRGKGAEGGGRVPGEVGEGTAETVSGAADLRGSLYERLNSFECRGKRTATMRCVARDSDCKQNAPGDSHKRTAMPTRLLLVAR